MRHDHGEAERPPNRPAVRTGAVGPDDDGLGPYPCRSGSLPVAGGLVALDRLLGADLEVLVRANLGRQLFGAITCRIYAAEWHSPREGLQRITVERPLRLR